VAFLLRSPACSAAAACRPSMQITGQPCRCSPANRQAAVQPDSKAIRGKGKIAFVENLVRETKLPTDPEIIARFIAATGLAIVHGGSSG